MIFIVAYWRLGQYIEYARSKDNLTEAICHRLGCNKYLIDLNKALHYYKLITYLGNTYAMNNLAVTYLNIPNAIIKSNQFE